MALQLAHERNGLLLTRAHTSTSDDRARILRILHDENADLSKAQACGHCTQLTARLTESLLHHLLFAKGQLPEPVSLLRKKKEKTFSAISTSTQRRSHSSSSHARREDKMLRKLDQLRRNLENAATQIATLADNNGEGPSSHPYTAPWRSMTAKDLRLLVVMGASATMPREVFVLDLIQSVGRCSVPDAASQGLNDDLCPVDGVHAGCSMQETDVHLEELLSEASDLQRDAARTKTSANWERKLVRLLVSDERLEAFLGSPLAPTKTHLFLSAPVSFRCPGWSARHHLDFDLDVLCESRSHETDGLEHATGSTDTSLSSLPPGSASSRKRAPPSPLQAQDRRWHKAACESSSSIASSWPEDSASEQLGESSISSVSDDSRPPSAADQPWHTGSNKAAAAEGWLAACSSPHSSHLYSPSYGAHSIETSRTGSSLGSSTVYGHNSIDAVTSSPRDFALSYDDTSEVRDHDNDLMDDSGLKVTAASASTAPSRDSSLGVRRRSREPKAGGLLSRNLLRAKQGRQNSYAGSDSSSVRSVASSLKRAPRCAGLRVDFTDPEQAADVDAAAMEQPMMERCWFQCEAVLEGFR
ncbi:hypothetical protein EX895_001620 [Sporisorium graminicola]|uniref:Uncharacterized protein n=1 Tax=Sporisorium graminicola TaxID=280036 RepID=A0A4V6EUC1_9BASI|nr:hypothetical protein EX895_001620 [Sporisorium graminicola]TKY89089.1 hypothetical protein EX895_001620 [Sporisorium graminicola]